MADKWMSYADAARALNMKPEGVRQRARREGWRKQMGNDGRALVLVPDDADRCPAGHQDGAASAPEPVSARAPAGKDTGEIGVLRARLVEVEARAVELRADLEREREQTARERAERLEERERAERLATEVAGLARQLAKAVEEAGSRERELQERLTAIRLAPWWRRLRRMA